MKLNKYGIHHWGVQGLPDDGSGARDDNSRPYKSDWVAPGKTVRPDHYRMPMSESSVDDTIRVLLQTLREGTGNKVDIHYKLGCAYLTKGERGQAISQLLIAHEQGFGDATEMLVELGVVEPPPPPPPPPRKMGKEELMSFALCIAEEMKHKR